MDKRVQVKYTYLAICIEDRNALEHSPVLFLLFAGQERQNLK